MSLQVLKNALIWGFILWAIGYVLGIVLFPFLPSELLGWVLMPIGTVCTLWVLLKKIKAKTFLSSVVIGVVWTLVAILCDYLFLVLIFKPADGYYKLDVYVYYGLTFILPILIGWKKGLKRQEV